MKKIIAIFLAMVLCLALSVTAFAAEGDSSTPGAPHDPITLSKAYTLNGKELSDEEAGLVPKETLSFAVSVPDGWTNPDNSVITVADVDTDADYTPDTEVIINGVFMESNKRSAPYFDLRIDGIECLNEAY